MEDAQVDLRRLFGLVQRQIRLIVAVTAACVVVCILLLLLITPTYLATSLVSFDPVAKDLLESKTGNASGLSDTARLEGEIEILRSDTLLLKVIAEQNLFDGVDHQTNNGWRSQIAGFIGLAKPDAFTDAQKLDHALATLRRAVSVQRRGLTYLIAIQAQSGNPVDAADLANAVSQTYIENQVSSKIDSLLVSRDIVQARLQNAREELVTSEAGFNAFLHQSISRMSAGEIDPDLQALSARLDALALDRKRTHDLVDVVASGLAANNWDALRLTLASTPAGVLIEQRASLATQIASAEPSAPGLTRLREDLAQIDRQVPLSATAALTDLREQVTAIDDEQRALGDQLRAHVMQKDLPVDILTGLYDLQSAANFAREQYQALLARSLELQNQSTLQVADSRVVSPALPPATPASPNRNLYLLAGLAGGLILGIALAVAYESVVGGFMSEEQLGAVLNTRVGASIPRLRLSASDDTLADMVITSPLSPFAEAMRRLRMTVDQTAKRQDEFGRTVLITSAVANEGKSTVALALARSYALSGRRTLLIDCDLRQPSIAQELGMLAQPGLLELLDPPSGQIQIRNAVRHENDTGLALILGAEGTDRPVDILLAGAAFERLLTEARKNFEIVVLDAPAVGPVVDALYIAPFADAALLLTRWASTSQRETRSAMASLSEAKAPHTRIISVLNDKVEKRVRRSKRQPRFYEADYA